MGGPTEMVPCDEGAVITGKIVIVGDFGIFVEISPDVEGLIDLSDLPGSPAAGTLNETYKEGDPIKVRKKAENRACQISLEYIEYPVK